MLIASLLPTVHPTTHSQDNGLKLPREFGLLVKQSLYFDRYLKILAPGLDVMTDTRVSTIGQDKASTEVNGSAGVRDDSPVIDV